MGAGGGSERGEKMPQVQSSALPGTCSRVTAEGRFQGRVAPDPRYRGTADEAEATLKTRVAAEAEAGETRVHALSSQHMRGEGIRKHACLWGKGEVRRGNASDK
jgi:hypothetical protein